MDNVTTHENFNPNLNLLTHKSEYKLHEVCSYTAVKPYILRFWETEFPQIAPVTTSIGQKLYSPKDIQIILKIKKLLWTDKLSLERAKLSLDMNGDYVVNTLSNISSEDSLELDREMNEAVAVEELTLVEAPAILEKKPEQYSDSHKQKLILAKAKLKSLLSLIETVKRDQHWV